jgi:dihydroneopterin aldolase
MDQLNITGLSVSTKIGAYAWEQRINQRLLIDITLSLDVSNCLDDLDKTIDYAALCQKVTAFVESKSFVLIETVAEEVAQLIKESYLIEHVTIRVSKPHAVKNANNVSITVIR